MASSSFARTATLLLSLLSLASAQGAPGGSYIQGSGATGSEAYQLVDDYTAHTFFDKFFFYSSYDPTYGHVQYVNKSVALQNSYVSTTPQGTARIQPDLTGLWPTGGLGRPSVRIISLNTYLHGLFVLDLNHIPTGCGSWPAYWLLGPNWPQTGEVDIIEGINTSENNTVSLHTSPGCTIAGSGQTTQLQNSNCDSSVNGNSGCGSQFVSSTSPPENYGSSFNGNGGGVYATEWTSDYIKTWFFPRGSTPASILSGSPHISDFGTPAVNMQGSCDIDAHFQNMSVIINIDFCGAWAGEVYSQWTNCPQNSSRTRSLDSCTDFVGNNPQKLTEAYFDINYLRVYQMPAGVATTSSYSTSLTSVAGEASTNSVPKGQGTTLKTTSSTPYTGPISSAASSSALPTATATSCPGLNNTLYTDAKKQPYAIYCGFDYGGPSPLVRATSSFETCMELCDSTSGCWAVSYTSGGICYIKNPGWPLSANANVNAAVRQNGVAPAQGASSPAARDASSTSTSPSSSSAAPLSSSARAPPTSSAAVSSSTQARSSSVPPSIISSVAVSSHAPSSTLSIPASTTANVNPGGVCGGSSGFNCYGAPAGNCCSEYGYCGSDSDHCGAGCQVGFGMCDPLVSSSMVSSMVSSSASLKNSSSMSMSNGQNLTSVIGGVTSTSMGLVPSNRTITSSWSNYTSPAMSSMPMSGNASVPVSTSAAASSAPTASACPSSTAAVCAGANTGEVCSSGGSTYNITCGIGFTSTTVMRRVTEPNLGSCIALCEHNETCVAVNYIGTECTLLSDVTGQQHVAGAVTAVQVPEDEPACSGSDGTTYTDGNSTEYSLTCYSDYSGNNIGDSIFEAIFTDCFSYCDSMSNCAGVVYDTTEHQCYLKSALAGAPTTNANRIVATRLRASGGNLPSSYGGGGNVPTATSTLPSSETTTLSLAPGATVTETPTTTLFTTLPTSGFVTSLVSGSDTSSFYVYTATTSTLPAQSGGCSSICFTCGVTPTLTPCGGSETLVPATITPSANPTGLVLTPSGTGTTVVFTTYTVTHCGPRSICPKPGFLIGGGGAAQSALPSGAEVITTTASNGDPITYTLIPTGGSGSGGSGPDGLGSEGSGTGTTGGTRGSGSSGYGGPGKGGSGGSGGSGNGGTGGTGVGGGSGPTATVPGVGATVTTSGTNILPTCPYANNQIFTDMYGEQYLIRCDTSYSNPTLSTNTQGRLADCVSSCDQYNIANLDSTQCAGVSYIQDATTNNCELKSGTTEVMRTGTHSARLISRAAVPGDGNGVGGSGTRLAPGVTVTGTGGTGNGAGTGPGTLPGTGPGTGVGTGIAMTAIPTTLVVGGSSVTVDYSTLISTAVSTYISNDVSYITDYVISTVISREISAVPGPTVTTAKIVTETQGSGYVTVTAAPVTIISYVYPNSSSSTSTCRTSSTYYLSPGETPVTLGVPVMAKRWIGHSR